jgi:hypothetical protein
MTNPNPDGHYENARRRMAWAKILSFSSPFCFALPLALLAQEIILRGTVAP